MSLLTHQQDKYKLLENHFILKGLIEECKLLVVSDIRRSDFIDSLSII
jgi:hypothetical protein